MSKSHKENPDARFGVSECHDNIVLARFAIAIAHEDQTIPGIESTKFNSFLYDAQIAAMEDRKAIVEKDKLISRLKTALEFMRHNYRARELNSNVQAFEKELWSLTE